MSSLQDQLLKLGVVDKPTSKAPAARPPSPSRPPPERPRLSARQLVSAGSLPKTDGRKRFYFERRSEAITYLELNDATVTRLERGEAAIVEAPSGKVTIVDGHTGEQLAESAPDWVRFRR